MIKEEWNYFMSTKNFLTSINHIDIVQILIYGVILNLYINSEGRLMSKLIKKFGIDFKHKH